MCMQGWRSSEYLARTSVLRPLAESDDASVTSAVGGGRRPRDVGRPVDHLKRPTEEARRRVAGRTDLPRKLRKRVVTIAERPNDRAKWSFYLYRGGPIWSDLVGCGQRPCPISPCKPSRGQDDTDQSGGQLTRFVEVWSGVGRGYSGRLPFVKHRGCGVHHGRNLTNLYNLGFAEFAWISEMLTLARLYDTGKTTPGASDPTPDLSPTKSSVICQWQVQDDDSAPRRNSQVVVSTLQSIDQLSCCIR